MERKGTTASINKKGKAITLFSKKDSFPIKITLVDKDDTVTDYILIKTSRKAHFTKALLSISSFIRKHLLSQPISPGRNQPADYVQHTTACNRLFM